MISIVIPARNSERTIKRCVESIFNSDYSDYEVIVVDDSSSDRTREIAQRFDCKIINLEKRVGAGKARNIGVDNSVGDIIAFTDSDCVVRKNWLSRIDKILNKKKGFSATTSSYCGYMKNRFISKFNFYEILFREKEHEGEIDDARTSSFAVKRKDFFEIRGFPEYYKNAGNEDMEIAQRLILAGKKVYHDPQNGVKHFFNERLSEYMEQQLRFAYTITMSALSNRNIATMKSKYRQEKVRMQLILTILFIIYIIRSFFMPENLIIAATTIMVIFFLNRKFLRMTAEKEGFLFTAKSLIIIPIRNIYWVSGMLKAIGKKILKLLVKDKN